MTVEILEGDCVAMMQLFVPDASVDAVVTDPPYGIRFMGKAWDGADIERMSRERAAHASRAPDAGPNGGHHNPATAAGKYDLSPMAMRAFQEFSSDWGREAFRVLKPGGHLLSFASTRTYHRMVCGLEEAGFEVRDQIGWVFGSGFPKSHNGAWGGTALKPAWEPIVLARKPLDGTVAANWAAHGTGALNIEACRVGGFLNAKAGELVEGLGRWPANLIHDGSDEVLAAFPQAPGQLADQSSSSSPRSRGEIYGAMRRGNPRSSDDPAAFAMKPGARRLDEGSAARFFYCAKTSKRDRNEGLDDFARTTTTTSDGRAVAADNAYQRGKTERANTHPTVKPTELMRYLCRLVTPAGGVVLDPFLGSGSTGKAAVLEGFRFIGCELSAEYVLIARARIAHALAQVIA